MTQLMARTPVLIAAEINSIKEQTRKMVLNNSIEIGRRLVEAKTMVAHGEWGRWLAESVDYSQSTANNLMRISEEYGNQLALFSSDVNSQALGNLTYTQAVALFGIPADEREKFVEEHDVSSMSTRQLQQAIKEKQALEKKLQESEAQVKKAQQEKQEWSKKYIELEQKSRDYPQLIEKLKTDLEFAIAAGNQEEVTHLQESLEQLTNEHNDSLAKIKELEKQLREKPIEVQGIVEKIPEEVEAELIELRNQVREQSDKTLVEFSVRFDQLVKGFQDILGALARIDDQEMNEKYKGAVKGLIEKMNERI